MDQPYSVAADFLSKFHTWPDVIQAMWIISLTLVTLTLIVASMRIVTTLIRAAVLGVPARRSVVDSEIEFGDNRQPIGDRSANQAVLPAAAWRSPARHG